MMHPKPFGKLGNRKMARLATEIDAGLMLPERSERCRLENISRTGCRLQLGGPPRVGATVLIRVERIETMGIVAWVRGNRCGVKFPEPLAIGELERIRWIVEHTSMYEQNSLTHATAVWR